MTDVDLWTDDLEAVVENSGAEWFVLLGDIEFTEHERRHAVAAVGATETQEPGACGRVDVGESNESLAKHRARLDISERDLRLD
jgi:hypothetical protein